MNGPDFVPDGIGLPILTVKPYKQFARPWSLTFDHPDGLQRRLMLNVDGSGYRKKSPFYP